MVKRWVIIFVIVVFFVTGIFYLADFKKDREYNINNKIERALNPNNHFNSKECIEGRSRALSGVIFEKKENYILVSPNLNGGNIIKVYLDPDTYFVKIFVNSGGSVIKQEEIDINEIHAYDSVVVSAFCKKGDEKYRAMLIKIIKQVN